MANKRMFVGGLPYSVTEDRLREVFEAHGTVESADVVTDKFTGQSRGFGFVEMGSVAEAEAAITALNETDLDGRQITVAEARERQRGGGGGGGGDRW